MGPILLCCAMNSTIFSCWNYLEKSYFKLLLASTLLSKPKKLNQTKGRKSSPVRSQVYSNLVQKKQRLYGPRAEQHNTGSGAPSLSRTLTSHSWFRNQKPLWFLPATQLSAFGQSGFNIQSIGNIVFM